MLSTGTRGTREQVLECQKGRPQLQVFSQGSLAQACFDRSIRLLARYGFEKFCRAKSLAIPHKAVPFVAACVPAV